MAFGCPPGEYNDLATGLLSRPPETIQRIFSLTNDMHHWRSCASDVPCNFTIKSLGLMSVIYLCLMALAAGISVPGGLFMPSIMVRMLSPPPPTHTHSRSNRHSGPGRPLRTLHHDACAPPLRARTSASACGPNNALAAIHLALLWSLLTDLCKQRVKKAGRVRAHVSPTVPE